MGVFYRFRNLIKRSKTMADKKKISLGGIDNAAEEKGSFMKALWQFIKFLVVSGLDSSRFPSGNLRTEHNL